LGQIDKLSTLLELKKKGLHMVEISTRLKTKFLEVLLGCGLCKQNWVQDMVGGQQVFDNQV
jgi:hypothetical protein